MKIEDLILTTALVALEPPQGGPWRQFVVTFYSHGCAMLGGGKTDPQFTASGEHAEADWSVAASKEDFPVGTVLEVSYKGKVERRIVHDRGGRIVSGRLDFFVKDCKVARQGGVREMKVREVRRPLGKTKGRGK